MKKPIRHRTWNYWRKYFDRIAVNLNILSLFEKSVIPAQKTIQYNVCHYDTLASLYIMNFISSGKWAVPDQLISNVILYRINHTLQFIDTLYATQGTKTVKAIVRPPDMNLVSEKDVLSWFLLTWWYNHGPHWFRDYRCGRLSWMMMHPSLCIKIAKEGILCENIYEGSEQLGMEFVSIKKEGNSTNFFLKSPECLK